MPPNADLVGRTYPPTASYEVGREKIREFADAIGDLNPLYRDADAARALGYRDVLGPPTFLSVLSIQAAMQVVQDPDSGLDYSRIVHGEQSFSFNRPVTAGDVLRITVTVDGIRTVGGHHLVTTRGEVATVNDEPVATATCLLIARGDSVESDSDQSDSDQSDSDQSDSDQSDSDRNGSDRNGSDRNGSDQNQPGRNDRTEDGSA